MRRKRHLAATEKPFVAACGRVDVVIVADWQKVDCRLCQHTTDFFLTSVKGGESLQMWREHYGPLTEQVCRGPKR
jgi:hypothetical protein